MSAAPPHTSNTNAIHNIPKIDRPRVAIVGGGFAGLKLAHKLGKKGMQIVLFDQNNYHQFQPLFYQVATAGLEPGAIAFPLRKALRSIPQLHIRVAHAERVNTEKKLLLTNIGTLSYDYLVLAMGADTNYFGNEQIQRYAIPMKSLKEALALRNILLSSYERALKASDPQELEPLLNVVIVGGGPTGVELAGAIAEMRNFILPKDYPELDFTQMKVFLLEGGPLILPGHSSPSSLKATQYLKDMGVDVRTGAMAVAYDGQRVTLQDGSILPSTSVIWAAGVKANTIDGLPKNAYHQTGRLMVDRQSRVIGLDGVFCLGDQACMITPAYPKGHPQVAQAALQQAELLSKNILALIASQPVENFEYVDKGSLATVGRNKAVADLPGKIRFSGFTAWLLWLFVHLMALVGIRNRVLVFINWTWSYFSYDKSFRLLIPVDLTKPTEQTKPPTQATQYRVDHKPKS